MLPHIVGVQPTSPMRTNTVDHLYGVYNVYNGCMAFAIIVWAIRVHIPPVPGTKIENTYKRSAPKSRRGAHPGVYNYIYCPCLVRTRRVYKSRVYKSPRKVGVEPTSPFRTKAVDHLKGWLEDAGETCMGYTTCTIVVQWIQLLFGLYKYIYRPFLV